MMVTDGLAVLIVTAAFLAGPAPAQDSGPTTPPLVGKVLVKGSPIHGANGIRFDGQGRLCIASVFGHEIVVMDPATGKILERLGPEKGVSWPDDLAFGPDGSLYWTSLLTGHVGRLSPDGSTKTQFVAVGANPITFAPDGRLFVGLFLMGDGLYQVDPELTAPPVVKSKDPGMLNAFAFGPDGLLYSPVPFAGMIVRMNVDSPHVAYQPLATGLGIPTAVKFNARGQLYGHSQLSGEVWRLDPATGTRETIATVTPGTDNVAFDARDRLFVSHAHDGTIYEILPGGQPRTISEGGMILPGGVAVLPSPQGGERVFVADVWTLREFNGLTGQPGEVARQFFDPSGLTSPLTVSADGQNLVLSSWIGNNVQVWNPGTRQVVENHPGFAVPINAIRFQNDLVVAELGAGRVVRVTPGGPVPLATGLYVPAGLAASGSNLYVGDWASGIVWKVIPDGSLVKIPLAMGLTNPEGLAVDLDGNLLVVESGPGRLSKIDVSNGAVTLVAEGLDLGLPAGPAAPPTWMFNGVAVGPSGAIYVTGDKTNVLYRLRFPH